MAKESEKEAAAMLLVPREELSAYFSNGSRFTNSEGMEISWWEEWGVFTSLSFYKREKGHFHETPIEMSISTSEDSLDDFINGFKIQKIEDIVKAIN